MDVGQQPGACGDDGEPPDDASPAASGKGSASSVARPVRSIGWARFAILAFFCVAGGPFGIEVAIGAGASAVLRAARARVCMCARRGCRSGSAVDLPRVLRAAAGVELPAGADDRGDGHHAAGQRRLRAVDQAGAVAPARCARPVGTGECAQGLGEFAGWLAGFNGILSSTFDLGLYPSLLASYLSVLCGGLGGGARLAAKGGLLVLGFALNAWGLRAIGKISAAITLSIFLPFFVEVRARFCCRAGAPGRRAAARGAAGHGAAGHGARRQRVDRRAAAFRHAAGPLLLHYALVGRARSCRSRPCPLPFDPRARRVGERVCARACAGATPGGTAWAASRARCATRGAPSPWASPSPCSWCARPAEARRLVIAATSPSPSRAGDRDVRAAALHRHPDAP